MSMKARASLPEPQIRFSRVCVCVCVCVSACHNGEMKVQREREKLSVCTGAIVSLRKRVFSAAVPERCYVSLENVCVCLNLHLGKKRFIYTRAFSNVYMSCNRIIVNDLSYIFVR